MQQTTVFHVTHEDNVESIKENGLKPSPSINHNNMEYVYVTRSIEEAKKVKDAYFAGPEAVTFKAKVYEPYLIEDPDPCGELDSYAHDGHIQPHSIEVVAE